MGWSHWEYAGKKRGKVTEPFFHGRWYGSEQQWNWASLECKRNPFSEITVKLHKGRELRGFQSDSLLTFLCNVLFDSKEDTEPWEIWQEWKMCNNMYQVCEIVAGDTRKWNSTPVSIKTSSFSWSWVFFFYFYLFEFHTTCFDLIYSPCPTLHRSTFISFLFNFLSFAFYALQDEFVFPEYLWMCDHPLECGQILRGNNIRENYFPFPSNCH